MTVLYDVLYIYIINIISKIGLSYFRNYGNYFVEVLNSDWFSAQLLVQINLRLCGRLTYVSSLDCFVRSFLDLRSTLWSHWLWIICIADDVIKVNGIKESVGFDMLLFVSLPSYVCFVVRCSYIIVLWLLPIYRIPVKCCCVLYFIRWFITTWLAFQHVIAISINQTYIKKVIIMFYGKEPFPMKLDSCISVLPGNLCILNISVLRRQLHVSIFAT